MINFAHRGASEVAPENTMTAFCIGLAMGANGIETDVRHTADNRLVLFHDATMKRINGLNRAVEDCTYDELLQMDFGAFQGEVYRGEKIVLFEDFLRYFRDKPVEFAIELKGADTERDSLDLIYRYGVQDKTVITSFHLEYLRRVRNFDSGIRLGYLTETIDDQILDELAQIPVKQICPRGTTLTPEAVQRARTRGFSVRAWGIKDRDVMAHTVSCGVDGMTVNFPDALKALLQK